ncbi:glycosyltransferase family 2 protein [Pseudomonadota bacterium]
MLPLSILITVYNREKFLAQTLESLLKSCYKQMEIIIVDDFSKDRSHEIAQQFADRDPRIQTHRNKHNLGDYPNRMKAASLANGRFIKFVDSDDLIYPHSLELMVDSMDKNPDAALGLSHSMPEDESPYPWCLSPEETYKKHFLGRGCLSCGPSGAIIRRDAFESIGGFQTQWKVISDTDLWYRMAARWPTVLLPPALVWWRRHDEQEFIKEDAEATYLSFGYELAKKALNDPICPLPLAEREVALKRNRQHFSRRLLSFALKKRRLISATHIYRESDLKISDLMIGLRAYQ